MDFSMASDGDARVKGKSLSQLTHNFDGQPKAASALTNQSERSRPAKRVTWKDEKEPPRSASTKVPTTPTTYDDSSPKSPRTLQYASPHLPSFRQDWFASENPRRTRGRLNSIDDAKSDRKRQWSSLARAAGGLSRHRSTEASTTLTCDDSSPKSPRTLQDASAHVPSFRRDWFVSENLQRRRGLLNSVDDAYPDLNRQRSLLARAAGDNLAGKLRSDTSGLDWDCKSIPRSGQCRETGFGECHSRGRSLLGSWSDDNDRANDDDNADDDDNTYGGDNAYGCSSKEMYQNTLGRGRQSTKGTSDYGVLTKDEDFPRVISSKCGMQKTRRNSGGFNAHFKPSRNVSPSADNRWKYSCSVEQASYFRRLRNDDPSLSVDDFSVDESDASSLPGDSFLNEEHGASSHPEDNVSCSFSQGRGDRNSAGTESGACAVTKEEISRALFDTRCVLSAASLAESPMLFSSRNGENVSSETSTGSENETNPVCMGILDGSVSKAADDTVDTESNEEDEIFVVNRHRQYDQSSQKTPPQQENTYSTEEKDVEEEKSNRTGSDSSEDNSDTRRDFSEAAAQQSEDTYTTAEGENDTSSKYFTAEDFSGTEYQENDAYSSENTVSSEGTDVEEALNLGNRSTRNFGERKMYSAEARKTVFPTPFSDSGDWMDVGNANSVSLEEDFFADEIDPAGEADASQEESPSQFTDSHEEDDECFLETVSDEADDYPEDEGHLLSDNVFADDEGAGVTSSEDYTDTEEAIGLSSQDSPVKEMLAATGKSIMTEGWRVTSSEENVTEGGLRAISPESNTTEEDVGEALTIGEEDVRSTLWGVDVGPTLVKDKRTEERVAMTSTEEETAGEETTGTYEEDKAEDEGQRLWSFEDSSAREGVGSTSPENDAVTEECGLSPPENNPNARHQGGTETASHHKSNVKGRDVAECIEAFAVESTHTESIPFSRAAATNSSVSSQIPGFSLSKECNEAFRSACKVGNNLVQNEEAAPSGNDHGRGSTEKSVTGNNGCLQSTEYNETEDTIKVTRDKLSARAQEEHRKVGAQRGGSYDGVYTDQNYHFSSPKPQNVSTEDLGSAKGTKAPVIVSLKPSVRQTKNASFNDNERVAAHCNSQQVIETNSNGETSFRKISPAEEVRAEDNFTSDLKNLPEKTFLTRNAGRPPKKIGYSPTGKKGALENAAEVSSTGPVENEGKLSLSVEDGTYRVSLSKTGSLQSKVSLTVRIEQGTGRVKSTATWSETIPAKQPRHTQQHFSETARQRQKSETKAECRRNASSGTRKQQRDISIQTEVDPHQTASKSATRQNVLSVKGDGEKFSSKTSRTQKGKLTIAVDTRQVSPAVLAAPKKNLNSENKASFHASNGQYVCEKCGNCYVRVEHLLAHHGEHPVRDLHLGMRCGGCGAQFVSSSALEHHVHLNRMPQAGFRCYRCLRQFRHCDDLYRHCQSQSRQLTK